MTHSFLYLSATHAWGNSWCKVQSMWYTSIVLLHFSMQWCCRSGTCIILLNKVHKPFWNALIRDWFLLAQCAKHFRLQNTRVEMNSNECSKLFVEGRYYIENFKKLNFDKLKQISNLQINTHICSESSGGDRRKNSIPENNFNACVHMTVNWFS